MTDRPLIAAAIFFGSAWPPGPRRSSPPAAGTGRAPGARKLRAFARLNDWVGEKILLSSSSLAPEYPTQRANGGGALPGVLDHRNRRRVYPTATGGLVARGRRPGPRAPAAHPGDAGGAARR